MRGAPLLRQPNPERAARERTGSLPYKARERKTRFKAVIHPLNGIAVVRKPQHSASMSIKLAERGRCLGGGEQEERNGEHSSGSLVKLKL